MRKKTCYIRYSSNHLNKPSKYYWDLVRDDGIYNYYALLSVSKDELVKLRDKYRR